MVPQVFSVKFLLVAAVEWTEDLGCVSLNVLWVVTVADSVEAARTSEFELVQHLLIQWVDRLCALVNTEALWARGAGLEVVSDAWSTGEFAALRALFWLPDDHLAYVANASGVELGYGVVFEDFHRRICFL